MEARLFIQVNDIKEWNDPLEQLMDLDDEAERRSQSAAPLTGHLDAEIPVRATGHFNAPRVAEML
jgi:hypothetical protein